MKWTLFMFEMDGAGGNTSAKKMQLFDVVYTMQVDDLQKQLHLFFFFFLFHLSQMVAHSKPLP